MQDRTVEDGGQTDVVDDGLRAVHLTLCRACREGAGGECHTPGCSLWMNRAPDLPVNSDFGSDKHPVQKDVEEFHRMVVGVDDPDTPALRRTELRASLIAEEARETLEAITGRYVTITIHDEATPLGPDLVQSIDGMCDMLGVIYGTASEFGVDLAPFWDEVHGTNMAKVQGVDRGKAVKPPGWTPPDIAGILDALTGSARP